MERSKPWIPHVEAFVDDSRPSSQHAASVNAITLLLKNDLLTLETLVREMELYLTNSDNVIRSRGTLLLAEILTHLKSKPLDSAAINSLVGFFTSRLADWHALRGALIGCLALLRRKFNVGMVADSDAGALAQSFLINIHVQSMAVQDRKLCFEVLQYLLDVYHEAIVATGEDLVYPICEAIDEERDPRCLMLTFHLVETLACLFPDPSGPVGSFAEDLFDILGRYFPIDFTHPSDDFEIKRGDLSRALMNNVQLPKDNVSNDIGRDLAPYQAICSAPYFEPFAVPLLLDKLSSSLPLAKLDSLTYLNNSILCYGTDRMLKHAKAIWSSLKDVIFHHSPQGPLLSSAPELVGDTESHETQIAKEALLCLQTAILQLNHPNSDPFLSLIIDDDFIEMIFVSVGGERSYSGMSEESLHQLRALGSILSFTTKVSSTSCSKVFQSYFHRLMDILGVTASSSASGCIANSKKFSTRLNFGALYLCVELLASCRDLSVAAQDSSEDLSQQFLSLQDSWWYLLQKFSCTLTYALGSASTTLGTAGVNENTDPEYFYYGVKGLQVLATFPGCYSPISEDAYTDILEFLMSVISNGSEDTFLWNVSLKALIQIGSFIEKYQDYHMRIIYSKVVIERIISMLSLDDSNMSLPRKLKATSEIGITGLNFMSRIIRGLQEAIFSNFLKACVEGNPKAAEIIVSLLECYSNQVLPWCHISGNFDEVAMEFAVNIWNQIKNAIAFDTNFKGQSFLDSTMMTMKFVVGGCTKENQSLIVQEAYNVISSTTFFSMESVPFISSKIEGLQFIDVAGLSRKDEWILSLFASVVIALRPQTPLPNARILLELFTVFLLKGHVVAAHALASMVNKWPEKFNETEVSGSFTLEEAIKVIFDRSLSGVLCSTPLRECSFMNNKESFSDTCPSSLLIHAVDGLAWIGKGLLMRGHEKVKEITMLLLKCLLSDQSMNITPLHQVESGNISGQAIHSLVARSAADAFHVFLSDSDFCLKKEFHASIKPLYKQRFFSSMIPVLLSLIKESDSSSSRAVLSRAFGHIISNTPLAAVVSDAKKVIPSLLDALTVLSLDILNKELLYSILLVLAGILMDENGKEAIIENTHTVISHLIRLVSYPDMTHVRETAIQCLIAMSGLPHTRIYPHRPQILKAVSKALDDRKRAVRQEAVKCRQSWALIASRSLHF